MKKTILSIIAVAITIAASAQTTTINQGTSDNLVSSYNSVKIKQEGESNITVKQRGSYGSFEVEQLSSISRNIIGIDQNGSYNETKIEQLGSSNVISVNQGNLSDNLILNKLDIQQEGADNIMTITQIDGGNSSLILVQNSEKSSIDIRQRGSDNITNVTQQGGYENSIETWLFNGGGNELSILQDGGSLNYVHLVISGESNTFEIEQSGISNSIVGANGYYAVQGGFDNYASIIQSGSNNRINFYQVGNNTSINFEQSGTNNVSDLNINRLD